MAEYIDRDKLLDELGESASYHAESGREYQLLLRDRNIVREQPTADVIERSKIDKAIDDSYKKGLTDAWECARKIGNNSQLGLEEMGFDFSELGTYYNPSWWVVFNYDVFKALEILKRNIGE